MVEIAGIGSFSLSDFDAELRAAERILAESSANARQATSLAMQSMWNLAEFNQRSQEMGLRRKAMERAEQLFPYQLRETQLELEKVQRINDQMRMDVEARRQLGEVIKPPAGDLAPPPLPGLEASMLDRAINRLPPDLQLTPFVMGLKQQRLSEAAKVLEMRHTEAQTGFVKTKTAELGEAGSADFATRASAFISDEELQRAKLSREKFLELATSEGAISEVRQGGAFKYARTIAGLGTAQKAGEFGAKALGKSEKQAAKQEVILEKLDATQALQEIESALGTEEESKLPESILEIYNTQGFFGRAIKWDEAFEKRLKEELQAWGEKERGGTFEPRTLEKLVTALKKEAIRLK